VILNRDLSVFATIVGGRKVFQEDEIAAPAGAKSSAGSQ